MPFLTDDFVVRRLDAECWETTHALVYQGCRQTFTVPARFRTDFASVPHFLTWLVPRYGIYTLAAVLHDWLCVCLALAGSHPDYPRTAPANARDTDALFRRVLREEGVGVVRRWLMYAAVRWGALLNRHRRAGWWRDAPAVLAASAVALPIVVPASVGIACGWLAYRLADGLARLLGGRP